MELIDQCKPQFFIGPNYDLPHSASAKRTRKCVDSCIQWHKDGLSAYPSLRHSLFAAIQGISSARDRARCAREIADLHPFGFYVGGQGLDESLELRQKDLADLKVRFLQYLGSRQSFLSSPLLTQYS
jgi:queuine/archaeosine tRNA-ribosyltransferase